MWFCGCSDKLPARTQRLAYLAEPLTSKIPIPKNNTKTGNARKITRKQRKLPDVNRETRDAENNTSGTRTLVISGLKPPTRFPGRRRRGRTTTSHIARAYPSASLGIWVWSVTWSTFVQGESLR